MHNDDDYKYNYNYILCLLRVNICYLFKTKQLAATVWPQPSNIYSSPTPSMGFTLVIGCMLGVTYCLEN